MHRFCVLLLCLVWGCSSLGAATLWSAGVTAETGWFDFNKTHEKGEQGDDLLCWAVVASNLLAWWQQQNSALVPQAAPSGAAVWQHYRQSFENEGSDPDQGIRWWFSGEYTRPRLSGGGFCAALREGAGAGYYRESGFTVEQLIYNGRGAAVTAESLTAALLRGFRRGDAFWVGVSLRKPDGRRFMHSINLWGIEEEEDRITAVYMCDSDDRQETLHRIPVVEVEGMLYLDCTGHALYGRLGRVVIDTYTGLRLTPAE